MREGGFDGEGDDGEEERVGGANDETENPAVRGADHQPLPRSPWLSFGRGTAWKRRRTESHLNSNIRLGHEQKARPPERQPSLVSKREPDADKPQFPPEGGGGKPENQLLTRRETPPPRDSHERKQLERQAHLLGGDSARSKLGQSPKDRNKHLVETPTD